MYFALNSKQQAVTPAFIVPAVNTPELSTLIAFGSESASSGKGFCLSIAQVPDFLQCLPSMLLPLLILDPFPQVFY
jgi:hypothetical protein